VGRLFRSLGGRRPTAHRTRLEVGAGLEVRHLDERGEDG